jgi:hypothetical protein
MLGKRKDEESLTVDRSRRVHYRVRVKRYLEGNYKLDQTPLKLLFLFGRFKVENSAHAS